MSASSFNQIFPTGLPDEELSSHFTGQSYFAMLTDGAVPVKNVTFEPGSRINWHVHHGSNGGGDRFCCVLPVRDGTRQKVRSPSVWNQARPSGFLLERSTGMARS